MISLARVLVLVESGTVEARQTMCIGWEMRRHPIDQHADIGAVAGIDESGKALRWAEAGAGREQTQRLIAPRTAKWMFGHRHQLDMREPHLADIRYQAIREFVPGRDAAFGMEP